MHSETYRNEGVLKGPRHIGVCACDRRPDAPAVDRVVAATRADVGATSMKIPPLAFTVTDWQAIAPTRHPDFGDAAHRSSTSTGAKLFIVD